MWEFMEKEVAKRLPFRNVQWRSTTGRQRTIDTLEVRFEKFDAKACLPPVPLPELYRLPLINLYLVSCDVCQR